MISFKKKFYLFKVTDTWFRFIPGLKNLFSLRTYSFVTNADLYKNTFCIRSFSQTIELSLEQTEENILLNFRKKTAQDIRKAKDLGIECVFNKDLNTFLDFYNAFARKKNIYPIKKSLFENFTDDYVVCYSILNGEILASHLQIFDLEKSIARGYLGGNRRFDENFDSRVIGMANKFLKSSELFYFKNLGIKTYDFGGYVENAKDKSIQGINEYKLSFGGQVKKCISFDSIPYFILRKLSEILDRRYN
jgi:hypothetical protein